jgi:hypothetical protein
MPDTLDSSNHGDRPLCVLLLVLDPTGNLSIQPVTDLEQVQRAPSSVEIHGMISMAQSLINAGMTAGHILAAQQQRPRIVPMPRNPRLG